MHLGRAYLCVVQHINTTPRSAGITTHTDARSLPCLLAPLSCFAPCQPSGGQNVPTWQRILQCKCARVSACLGTPQVDT